MRLISKNSEAEIKGTSAFFFLFLNPRYFGRVRVRGRNRYWLTAYACLVSQN